MHLYVSLCELYAHSHALLTRHTPPPPLPNSLAYRTHPYPLHIYFSEEYHQIQCGTTNLPRTCRPSPPPPVPTLLLYPRHRVSLFLFISLFLISLSLVSVLSPGSTASRVLEIQSRKKTKMENSDNRYSFTHDKD